MRIAMLSANLPPRPCGVGDFAARLAGELIEGGSEVVLMCRTGGDAVGSGISVISVDGGPWHIGRARQVASRVLSLGVDLFHYHYVPFLYGSRGLSLGGSLLPEMVRRRDIPVVTTLHELAMPWDPRPGRLAVAALQRVQLALLVAGSDAIVVTTGHRARMLRRWYPWKAGSIRRVPVGATVEPDRRTDREAVRRDLGLDGRLTVGFLGTAHPSKNLALVVQCVEDMIADGIDARLLCVGLERSDLLGATRGGSVVDAAVCTGWIPVADRRISALTSAVDLYLAPMADGISTLRTSVMAALAHGLPVVGTVGRETDPELLEGKAISVAPVEDPAAFRKIAVDLARDPERRAALGREAVAFYRRLYSWPALARATGEVYALALNPTGPSRSARRGDPDV